MIRYTFNYPIETKLVNEEGSFEGPRSLDPPAGIDYEARVARVGSELVNASQVRLSHKDDFVSGVHRVRQNPTLEGLFPRAFSEPFHLEYAYDTGPLIGQSEKGVQDFHPFVVNAFEGSDLYSKNLKNMRVTEYEGSVYMVGEIADPMMRVHLYKMDSDTLEFNLVKVFDEVVVDDSTSNQEEGSPDLCVHDGALYVAYRSADRGGDSSSIAVWNSEDLVDWRHDVFPVENTFGALFTDFRLRMASGLDSLCIVFYATRQVYNQCAILIQLRDMRSMISTDGGGEFRFSHDSYSSFNRSTGTSEYTEAIRHNALYNYFIPSNKRPSAPEEYFCSVNFDLYFDEAMASFVVVKGGDPDGMQDGAGDNNTTYLMAIKTVDGSFLDWEPCLNMKTDDMVARSDWSDDRDSPSREVTDVCVVPGETVSDIFVTMGDGRQVAHAEFSFVGRNLFKPGTTRTKPFAYGKKSHPEYVFVSTYMDSRAAGLVTTGNPSWAYESGLTNSVSNPYAYASSCRWRNQIVTIVDIDGNSANPDSNSRRFMSLKAPMGAVTELYQYQYGYCRYYDGLEDWGWGSQVLGSGSTGRTEFNGDIYNVCTINATNDEAYYNSGSFFEKLGPDNHFKLKFQFLSEALPVGTGSIHFLEVSLPGTEDAYLQLRLYQDGTVSLIDEYGSIVQDVAQTTIGTPHELLLCYHLPVGGTESELVAWNRAVGERDWASHTVVPYSGVFRDRGYYPALTGEPRIKLGVFNYGGFGDNGPIRFGVGDVHASTLDESFEPGFTSVIGTTRRGSSEGIRRYGTASTADPLQVYSNRIRLHDGSIIEIDGGRLDEEAEDVFRYGHSLTRNSARNLVNGMADSVYDFTPVWDSSQGYIDFIFENVEMGIFDMVSLVNISGVYDFTLFCGEYDPVTGGFTTGSQEEYSIPYLDLNHVSTIGRTVVVEETFDSSILKGNSVIAVDPSTSPVTPVYHYLVVDNYDGILELDRPVGDLTNLELRLMSEAASFDVPDRFKNQIYPHIAVRLYCPSDNAVLSMGEIVPGRLVDVSNYMSDASENVSSNFDIVESDYGFLFPSMIGDGNMARELTLTADGIDHLRGDYQELFYVLNSLWLSGMSFPLVIGHGRDGYGGLTEYAVINGGFNTAPSANSFSIEIPLLLDDWNVKPGSTKFNSPPEIYEMSADTTHAIVNQSVIFDSVVADPDGDVVTKSWDFGDGSVVETPFSVTNSFSTQGVYEVVLTASDPSGAKDVEKLVVYVEYEPVDTYTMAFVPSPVEIGTVADVNVRSVGASGFLVEDSTTEVTISIGSQTDVVLIDSNNAPQSSITRTLMRGEAQFGIESDVVGDYTVTLTDTFGRSITKTVSFDDPVEFDHYTLEMDPNFPYVGNDFYMAVAFRNAFGDLIGLADGSTVRLTSLDGNTHVFIDGNGQQVTTIDAVVQSGMTATVQATTFVEVDEYLVDTTNLDDPVTFPDRQFALPIGPSYNTFDHYEVSTNPSLPTEGVEFDIVIEVKNIHGDTIDNYDGESLYLYLEEGNGDLTLEFKDSQSNWVTDVTVQIQNGVATVVARGVEQDYVLLVDPTQLSDLTTSSFDLSVYE